MSNLLWEDTCYRVGFFNAVDYLPAWTLGLCLLMALGCKRSPNRRRPSHGFATVLTLCLSLGWALAEDPQIGYITEFYSDSGHLGAWMTLLAVLSPQLVVFFSEISSTRRRVMVTAVSVAFSLLSIAALASKSRCC